MSFWQYVWTSFIALNRHNLLPTPNRPDKVVGPRTWGEIFRGFKDLCSVLLILRQPEREIKVNGQSGQGDIYLRFSEGDGGQRVDRSGRCAQNTTGPDSEKSRPQHFSPNQSMSLLAGYFFTFCLACTRTLPHPFTSIII